MEELIQKFITFVSSVGCLLILTVIRGFLIPKPAFILDKVTRNGREELMILDGNLNLKGEIIKLVVVFHS